MVEDWPEFRLQNRVGTLAHENQHMKQPGGRGPELASHASLKSELGPLLGDLTNAAEVFKQTQGKPLQHSVDFPSGKSNDVEWMRQQAQNHGVFTGDKTIDQLMQTQAGLQYLRQLLEPQIGPEAANNE
jgi:hypothetical protein